MRYVLDFGDGTEGTTPTFLVFKNADTLADLTPPTIVEVAQGLFYFDWTWSSTATSITYKASTLGVELSDVITSDAVSTGTGVASTGTAIPDWADTAGNIINTAAVECGLSEWSDPYASTDANAVRLRTLLRSVGRELLAARAWKALVRECTVTGDGATTTFSLPSDFARMVDDSGWDRTGSTPFALLSSENWQAFKAATTTGTLLTYYRIVQNRIQFYSAPANASALAFDYVSRYWVASVGAATANVMQPAASGDSVILDPLLVKRCLVARFLAATGQMGRIEAEGEVLRAIADEPSEPAETLSLSGPRHGFRAIDEANWPETGFGS